MSSNVLLIVGAVLSATMAILHIGIIAFGASWYRFFGAGEQMAMLAEQGSIRPTLITSFIVVVLSIWSLYAFSGAGIVGKMPFLRLGLTTITALYLIRGILGFFLISNPMSRSPEFWLLSSTICLAIGLIHLIGLKQIWERI